MTPDEIEKHALSGSSANTVDTGNAARPQRAPSLLKLPVNTWGRDWFVGDLHGEYDLVQAFLKRVSFDPVKDRLIAVGDLVDRGRQSQALLEFFDENPAWFYSTLGNHDALMREAVIFGSWDAERGWGRNGGHWAAQIEANKLERLASSLLRMPLAIEVAMADGRRVGVVHAEIPTFSSWSDVAAAEAGSDEAMDYGGTLGSYLLWARRRVGWAWKVRRAPKATRVNVEHRAIALRELTPVAGIDLLITGHTRLLPRIPLACSNMLWIDTGGGYEGGRLSFVNLMAGEYVQLSHVRPRFRRHALPKACSLEHWQLSSKEADAARVILEAAEARRQDALQLLLGAIC